MHRFSANYIFPICKPPIKNGIIVIDDDGTIIEVIDPKGNIEELASMEFYNGVLVPGFVNTHCHLELSHLKGKIKNSTGIAEFVSQIRNLRGVTKTEINESIKIALKDESNNGVVAIGDICNTTDTIEFKKNSKILFHNFIEQFGLSNDNAVERVNQSLELLSKFQNISVNSSIVPHSTYSLSEILWELIGDEIKKTQQLVSIHFAESKQEYELLRDKSGLLAENFKKMGIPLNLPNCKTPVEIVKKYIQRESKVLFVHNTFASKDEIRQLSTHFSNPFFVLCPSSNLFIEGCLPNVPMIAELGVNIALGTDSYASSNTISIFDQMMILLNTFPSLTFNEVLKWGTINGAKALGFDSAIGSFEVGKKPGINLITNFDFAGMTATADSKLRRLV